MPIVHQASFAGGEVSPLLYGRSDLAKYAVAVAQCRDFYVNRQGQAVSRPGTEFCHEVKDSSLGRVRLIPFIYSDADTNENYVLEFGHHYVRFYRDGALVMTGPDVPLQVTTPYDAADLPFLKHVQSGDILTLTHHRYTPRELRHYDANGWTLLTIGLTPVLPLLLNNTDGYLYEPLSTGDETHFAKRWVWKVSSIYSAANGGLFETLPRTITHALPEDSPDTVGLPEIAYYVGPDRPVKVRAQVSSMSFPNPIKGLLIYRGIGDIFGLVGSLDETGDFLDYGNEPDYSRPPRVGTNPFLTANGVAYFHRYALSLQTEDYPSVCSYFEERLTFARTDSRPAGLFFSATADYYNFDELLLANAAMSANFDLAARSRQEIRSLVPLSKLLVFTNSAVWAVSGAGGPLQYNSVDAKVQLEVGANWVSPVVVDGAVIFARSKGTGVRALGYDLNQGSFAGMDISVLAPHLFEGHEVTDMAYAEDPDSLVWVVLDNGYLASLTFHREQDVWAWALHDLSGGIVESACCIPEGDEDVLYLEVVRTVNGTTRRYIERMKSRRLRFVTEGLAYTEQPWCLDCATVQIEPEPTTSITGLGHLEGRTVYCLGDGVVYGPAVVVGGGLTMEQPVANVIVGLRYQPKLESLDLVIPGKETRLTQKVLNRVMVEVADSSTFSAGPDFDSLREWRSRRISDAYGPTLTRSEAAEVDAKGGWGPKGRVCIMQPNPLPLTVLGVTREVTVGDPA